jgi:hypothetical protein
MSGHNAAEYASSLLNPTNLPHMMSSLFRKRRISLAGQLPNQNLCIPWYLAADMVVEKDGTRASLNRFWTRVVFLM